MNRDDQAQAAIRESLTDWAKCERGWLVDPDALCEREVYREDSTQYAGALFANGAYFRGVAGPGLVSVPTSDVRRWRQPTTPFRVKAESAEARRSIRLPVFGSRDSGARTATAWGDTLEAFEVDAEARRLAMLRMNVGFAARAHCVAATVPERCCMVTLTYAGTNEAWSPRHISTFLQRVRDHLARRAIAFRYVWVAELQTRGVIHYHVALFLPEGFELPKPDQWFARRWRGPAQPVSKECAWWPYGYSRIETARAAVPYLMHYLTKGREFGHFPKGARIYGCGGLDHAARRARRWLGLPAFVRGNGSMYDDWKRAKGGGWHSPDGTHSPSEFKRLFVGSGPALVRVHRHVRAFEADGPFAWLTDRDRALSHAKQETS